MLVTYLGKSALFLVAEKEYFGADLVRSFSIASLVRYAESSLNGQTFKVRCLGESELVCYRNGFSNLCLIYLYAVCPQDVFLAAIRTS